MRDLFRGVCLLATFVCFLLTFSFKVTGGRTYSKLEVGLVGPWWTREDRAGKIANSLAPLAGSALCGYSVPLLVLARALTRKRPE
jgi:hypothetical protein